MGDCEQGEKGGDGENRENGEKGEDGEKAEDGEGKEQGSGSGESGAAKDVEKIQKQAEELLNIGWIKKKLHWNIH